MNRGQQHGHTLFEILLALGLSLVLLVAVYSALDMHWKYSAAGRDEMERLQLTRALTAKLQLDIRSVVYRDPAETAAASRGPDFPPPFGLIGDEDRLRLQVGRPLRNRARSSDKNDREAEMTLTGLSVVSWQMAEGRPAVDKSASASHSRGDDVVGLARIDADRLSSTQSDSGAVLAEEVIGLKLRYFDGATWHTTWDTSSRGRLPRAIEVTIQFRPLPTRPIKAADRDNTNTQRVVIAVPLSEPSPLGREA